MPFNTHNEAHKRDRFSNIYLSVRSKRTHCSHHGYDEHHGTDMAMNGHHGIDMAMIDTQTLMHIYTHTYTHTQDVKT